MSERSPLLPRAPAHKRSDHSMFLRVCHSPHRFIGQRTLQALRGLISVYMIGAFAAKMYYDYEIVHHFGNDVGAVNHGWRAVFELSNLSWLLLTMYEAVAFVRCFCTSYAAPDTLQQLTGCRSGHTCIFIIRSYSRNPIHLRRRSRSSFLRAASIQAR